MKYADGATIVENFRKGFEGTTVSSIDFNQCLAEVCLGNIVDTRVTTDSTQEISIQYQEPYADRTITGAISHMKPEFHVTFTCPCCGTHYIARSEGFIPNCHNCGSVMKEVS